MWRPASADNSPQAHARPRHISTNPAHAITSPSASAVHAIP